MHVPDLLGHKPAFEIFFESWCEPCRHDNLRQRPDASTAGQADGAFVAAGQIVIAGLHLPDQSRGPLGA
jgi:hypothetical protein